MDGDDPNNMQGDCYLDLVGRSVITRRVCLCVSSFSTGSGCVPTTTTSCRRLVSSILLLLVLRGGRGVLKLPADWLLRLPHNPFYDYLEARALAWM